MNHTAKSPEDIIQFDNSDGSLPVDTTTVVISRKVHNSGKIIYRLNGRRRSKAYILEILFTFAKNVTKH